MSKPGPDANRDLDRRKRQRWLPADADLEYAIFQRVREIVDTQTALKTGAAITERHAINIQAALAAYVEMLDLRTKMVAKILQSLPDAKGLTPTEKELLDEALDHLALEADFETFSKKRAPDSE